VRVLCLDLGEKRIGVAISDPEGILASPLSIIESRQDDSAIGQIVVLALELQVERIIVGLPRSLDGTEGPQAQIVRNFVENLKSLVDVPVDVWDERLSTVAANRMMAEARVKKKKKKEKRDAIAAAIILQSYLDAEPEQGRG